MPVLIGGLDAAAVLDRPALPSPASPDRLWSESVGANELPSQRWGVIAPVGDVGDALLDSLAPLISRRSEQQGAPAMVFRVPSDLSPDQAARWKKRYLRPEQDGDREVPRYLLLLGDLDQVPASLQTVLASDGFIGRLAFDQKDDYRAYAEKVLRWEEWPASAREGDAVLHTIHDGTPAIVSGYQSIMAPGLKLLRQRRSLGEVQARDLRLAGGPQPSIDELWAAAESDRPRVLVTMAHGEGAPLAGWRSAALQRRYQGAVSFGNGVRLTGLDVENRSFLPGGIWFLLSCFGAGTPVTSVYQPWIDELGQVGHVGRDVAYVLDSLALERPFIAGLPKALLANPNGPLAVIGHIDLAWSYSFMDLDDRPQHQRPGRFMNLVQSLLARDRVGVALRALSRLLGEVSTELLALDENSQPVPPRDRARRAHLWMLRNDLAGYVLIGDPAVRLPLAPEEIMATAAPAIRSAAPNTMDLLDIVQSDDIGRKDGAARLPLPVDQLERAIGKVLSGCFALAHVAREHGLRAHELDRWVERYRAAGRAALTET